MGQLESRYRPEHTVWVNPDSLSHGRATSSATQPVRPSLPSPPQCGGGTGQKDREKAARGTSSGDKPAVRTRNSLLPLHPPLGLANRPVDTPDTTNENPDPELSPAVKRSTMAVPARGACAASTRRGPYIIASVEM
jgi:hypothetical protein